MKKYVFLFEASIYNGKLASECGFIPADTFGEAMGYLEKYYGDTLGKVQLECADVGIVGLITMDRETARKIWKDNT